MLRLRINPLQPTLPDLPVRRVQEMGLKELERIRLILRGGSIIDWRRLHFQARDEVDRFLRLCQIDPSNPHDEAWARTVLGDAVEYLRRTFNYRVAAAVAQPSEIHDLFLYASGSKEPHRYRKIACIVLKVMHVIQHIEGRDLLYRLAISEEQLQELVTARVIAVAREIHNKGLPVTEFTPSMKTLESIVTKLLAKKETVAAQIYDKIRFRIVTKTRPDILPVLYFLSQRLFPFNFVIPGQTENTLVNFKALLVEHPHLASYAHQLTSTLTTKLPRPTSPISSRAAPTACLASSRTFLFASTRICRRRQTITVLAKGASVSRWSNSRSSTSRRRSTTSRATMPTSDTRIGRSCACS